MAKAQQTFVIIMYPMVTSNQVAPAHPVYYIDALPIRHTRVTCLIKSSTGYNAECCVCLF